MPHQHPELLADALTLIAIDDASDPLAAVPRFKRIGLAAESLACALVLVLWLNDEQVWPDSDLSADLKRPQVPVLLFPHDAAEAYNIEIEKTYLLWIYNSMYMDDFYPAMKKITRTIGH